MKLIASAILTLTLLDACHCSPLIADETNRETKKSSSWGIGVGIKTGLEVGTGGERGILGIKPEVGIDLAGHRESSLIDINRAIPVWPYNFGSPNGIPVPNYPLFAPQAVLPNAPLFAPQAALPNAPLYAPQAAPPNAPLYAPQAAPPNVQLYAPQAAPPNAPLNGPQAAPSNAPLNGPQATPTNAQLYAPQAAPLNAPQATLPNAPLSAPQATSSNGDNIIFRD